MDEAKQPLLTWSAELEPTKEMPYNHCIAETPSGRFLITWKGWKEYPAFSIDETPQGITIFDDENSLQAAKDVCEEKFVELVLALDAFLKTPLKEKKEAEELKYLKDSVQSFKEAAQEFADDVVTTAREFEAKSYSTITEASDGNEIEENRKWVDSFAALYQHRLDGIRIQGITLSAIACPPEFTQQRNQLVQFTTQEAEGLLVRARDFVTQVKNRREQKLIEFYNKTNADLQQLFSIPVRFEPLPPTQPGSGYPGWIG